MTRPADPPAPPAQIDPRQVPLGDLAVRMGITLTHAEPGDVRATMPVAGNTQPLGLLHGGANAVLAETVGSISSFLHAAPDRAPVGIELSCTHHRAATSGSVHARTTPLSLGRTLASHAITIVDDTGRLVCSARLTCLLRPAGAE